jgi:hypothetical protein
MLIAHAAQLLLKTDVSQFLIYELVGDMGLPPEPRVVHA